MSICKVTHSAGGESRSPPLRCQRAAFPPRPILHPLSIVGRFRPQAVRAMSTPDALLSLQGEILTVDLLDGFVESLIPGPVGIQEHDFLGFSEYSEPVGRRLQSVRHGTP